MRPAAQKWTKTKHIKTTKIKKKQHATLGILELQVKKKKNTNVFHSGLVFENLLQKEKKKQFRIF